MTRNPGSPRVARHFVCRKILPLLEQPHGRVDRNHLIIVREVGVNGSVKGEGGWVGVKGTICLRFISDRLASQASEEFVDVSDALDGPERLTISGMV